MSRLQTYPCPQRIYCSLRALFDDQGSLGPSLKSHVHVKKWGIHALSVGCRGAPQSHRRRVQRRDRALWVG